MSAQIARKVVQSFQQAAAPEGEALSPREREFTKSCRFIPAPRPWLNSGHGEGLGAQAFARRGGQGGVVIVRPIFREMPRFVEASRHRPRY
jgi:hypothetical protein